MMSFQRSKLRDLSVVHGQPKLRSNCFPQKLAYVGLPLSQTNSLFTKKEKKKGTRGRGRDANPYCICL